jgi:hypothetical protein
MINIILNQIKIRLQDNMILIKVFNKQKLKDMKLLCKVLLQIKKWKMMVQIQDSMIIILNHLDTVLKEKWLLEENINGKLIQILQLAHMKFNNQFHISNHLLLLLNLFRVHNMKNQKKIYLLQDNMMFVRIK